MNTFSTSAADPQSDLVKMLLQEALPPPALDRVAEDALKFGLGEDGGINATNAGFETEQTKGATQTVQSPRGPCHLSTRF